MALPFTFLASQDSVRLVAGEDFRYTVLSAGIDKWLPGLAARFDGRAAIDDLLATVPSEFRQAAADLIERFYAERIVFDGTAEDYFKPSAFRGVPEGTGAIVQRLQAGSDFSAQVAHPSVHILCQDRLDYLALMEFNQRMLAGRSPWMWVSYGALVRGYVSPLFLPDAGPCLCCLLRHFERLSPVPEFYTELVQHARAGKMVTPVSFPETGLEILRQIVKWKLEAAALSEPPAGLFRLHVVEADSLEVRVHRVFRAPRCPECTILR
ncbi:MAG: TOMM precursor leader peptide-binding protein [Planctomycetaceae bacterium]